MARVAAGWEAEIVAFDVDPAVDGLAQLVLRMFSGNEQAFKATREYTGLRLLADAGYPAPRVVWFDPHPESLGSAYIAMERVDGVLYGHSMNQAGGLVGPAGRKFVRLMVDLHELDWTRFAQPLTGEPFPRPLTTTRRRLESWKESFAGLPGFMPVGDWLLREIDHVAPEPPAVVHGDFHPWNVLVDATDRMTVIDWSGVGVLDRRFDLAWSLLLAGAYQGQPLRDMFEQLYREMAKTPITDLEFFDAAAATMRLHHLVVSLTRGAGEFGMQAEAVKAMREDTAPFRWCADLLADRTGLTIPEVEAALSGSG